MTPNYTTANKILSLKELLFHVHAWKAKGFTVGFTNGCFDILHKGHVSYLERAKQHCSYLIVAVNADASVKKLKGENRPVNNELDRSYVLSGLVFVDAITIFETDTPLTLIQAIQPDFLFKGGDYDAHETDQTKPSYIVGSDIVRKNGGVVMSVPFVEGYSTTSILAKTNQTK